MVFISISNFNMWKYMILHILVRKIRTYLRINEIYRKFADIELHNRVSLILGLTPDGFKDISTEFFFMDTLIEL